MKISFRISCKIVIYLFDPGDIVSNKCTTFHFDIVMADELDNRIDNKKNRSQLVSRKCEKKKCKNLVLQVKFLVSDERLGARKSLILCPYFPHKMW